MELPAASNEDDDNDDDDNVFFFEVIAHPQRRPEETRVSAWGCS